MHSLEKLVYTNQQQLEELFEIWEILCFIKNEAVYEEKSLKNDLLLRYD